MAKDIGDDALADDIIAFFKTEFGEDVAIGPAERGDGLAIETDAGASFSFEIHGATRAEVALRYFEHIRFVYKFVVENRRSGAWLDGGRVYSRAEKEHARRCLAKLDAWAAQNLKS
ncbi:MAG: hypothetical protein RL272_1030 [Candidatus Parcubacteria bacterium]|jgi:hypothetical protein